MILLFQDWKPHLLDTFDVIEGIEDNDNIRWEVFLHIWAQESSS